MRAIVRWTLETVLLLTVYDGVVEAAQQVHGAARLRTSRPFTWSGFHLHSYLYVGLWENQHYQAEVWIRSMCHNQTHNVLRMLMSVHQAPFINTGTSYGPGAHSETPLVFHTNTTTSGGSILPKVWFESPAGSRTYAAGLHWDAYRTRVPSTARMSTAELRSDVSYTVGLQGSERVHQLPIQCTSRKHRLFADNTVWMGITEVSIAGSRRKQPAPSRSLASIDSREDMRTTARSESAHMAPARTSTDHNLQASLKAAAHNVEQSRHSSGSTLTGSTTTAAAHEAGPTGDSSQVPGAPTMNNSMQDDTLPFLVVQHLRHHLALGFSGTIMVVTPHTANSLMTSKEVLQSMHKQQLILVIWDSGLEMRASHFIQIPANNLLRLAAWGSSAKLALFDLDEYLVLPKHRAVTQEITEGCLNGALTDEAIIHSSWVWSTSWTSQPDVFAWMQHRSWRAAVAAMKYEVSPYTFCDGVCKAIINPNVDFIFQVHQHTQPVQKPAPTVSRSCAYLLHFHNLWSTRRPTIAYSGGGGAPLELQDLPHHL